ASSGYLSSTSVPITPSHAYAAIGTYDVTISVTDKDGDTGTGTLHVTIANRAPIATAGGPYNGVEGSSVALDGSGSSDPDGDALIYAWDFGDGASATGAKASHTYADNGTYTATLTVTDSQGAQTAANVQVTIANVAPSVGPINGVPGDPIAVGTLLTLNASFADPGADANWQYRVNWGDGTPISIGFVSSTSVSISSSHTYAAIDTYMVTVSVADKDGARGTSTLNVTILNRAPIANAGGPNSGVEGSSIAFDGSASSDPDGDALSYAWSFGDGASATGATASHKYADNGTYTATLTVTDSHGAQTAANVQVAVANVTPSVGPINGIPNDPIPVGALVTLSASFADPRADANWQYLVNWGDGTTISSGFISSSGVPISSSHTYAAMGTFVVTVSVTDKDGARGTRTVNVTTLNRAPVANAGGPYSGVEGSSVAFDGSASSDSDGDALSYAWDFGDGASATGAKASHTYVDNGTYTAKLKVTDSRGAQTTATTQVTIANAAPVLGEISGIPEEPIQVGTPVTLTASFTDANPADGFVGAVQWDLASSFTTAGVITIAPTSNDGGLIRATTTLQPGVYTVTLRVQDKDGGTAVSSTAPDYIVVYDPLGGFVTGGGWFWSPSGACRLTVSCGSAQGKATFGFVSKYLKGATTP